MVALCHIALQNYEKFSQTRNISAKKIVGQPFFSIVGWNPTARNTNYHELTTNYHKNCYRPKAGL